MTDLAQELVRLLQMPADGFVVLGRMAYLRFHPVRQPLVQLDILSTQASQEELEGVPGVPAKTGRQIYAALHRTGRA